MKVSFAITYKDEMSEIHDLLIKFKRWLSEVSYEYEIVILQDNISDRPLLPSDDYRLVWREFDRNYSAHKNYLNSQCTGDYIFQIDADEYPSTTLVLFLGYVLAENPSVDLFWTPRVNTVDGITNQHIQQWGWHAEKMESVGDAWVINWPDYQSRIYRNDPKIHWVGTVHEHIEGAMTFTRLPQDPLWALYHPKTIDKQIQQNKFYMTIPRHYV